MSVSCTVTPNMGFGKISWDFKITKKSNMERFEREAIIYTYHRPFWKLRCCCFVKEKFFIARISKENRWDVGTVFRGLDEYFD